MREIHLTKNTRYLSVCYHYIRSNEKKRYKRILGLPSDEFERQVVFLKKNYQILSLNDVDNLHNGNLFLKKMGMLITFDDGLKDHYLAAKILSKHGIKGVFFIPTCILTDKTPANPIIIHYAIAIFGISKFLVEFQNALKHTMIPKKDFEFLFEKMDNPWKKIEEIKLIFKYRLNYKQSRKILLYVYNELLKNSFPHIFDDMHLTNSQIKQILKMGHSVGVHTHSHISVAATKLSKSDFKKEMIQPKKILEKEFGKSIISFSYPFGEKNDYLLSEQLLKKTKMYNMAFTVEHKTNSNKSSPLELGRYQPSSKETTSTLSKNLKKIQSGKKV